MYKYIKPVENKKSINLISDEILQAFILVGLAQRFLRKSELPECSKHIN